MSIYAALKDRLPEDNPHASTRQATIILGTNGDPEKNDPLLGITYQCDFRSEEETGAGAMKDLFTRTSPDSFMAKERARTEAFTDINRPFRRQTFIPEGAKQADFVYQDDRVVAFAASTHIYDPKREIEMGEAYLRESEGFARGIPHVPTALWRASRDELRAMAKERGIKGYSKMKRETLMHTVHEHDHADLPVTNVHPGWFHFGTLLVLPRTDDVFGAVLDRLVDAAKAGTLSVGSGGGLFGSGFSFFDERDLSDDAKVDIARGNTEYIEDMEALRPVAEEIKARHGYYFLGNPRREGGTVRYWLNGASLRLPSGRTRQPFGWYTTQELLDEKYVQDAEDEEDKREAREKETV